jgi:dTDP-4-amino-4,6-dideoxygalactose transaminase
VAIGVIRFQKPQLPRVEQVAAYFAGAEKIRWFSNRGPCYELLVERLEAFLGGVRCVPVANGTLALMLSLRAVVGSVEGDAREVLMPSFTFAATINAVLWCGLRPVFVDVEERSWHLDADCLQRALARRRGSVAAVLACSTFGIPPSSAQQAAWEDAARAADIPLIVDSAAGFGAATKDGKLLGRQGDAEVFSFHATKPFAIGEGGLVTTSDARTAERVTRLANFGFEDGVVESDIGLNAKLTEWSAATALAVLDGYDDVLERRRARAERILQAIEPHGYRSQAGTDNAVWQFVPVLAPSPAAREAAIELAAQEAVELRSYYAVPLHRMPAFSSTPIAGDLRCTEYLAERTLSLPMANDLGASDIDLIVDSLERAAGAAFDRSSAPARRFS